MLWMSAVVMATWQEYNELRDPTYSYKLDTDNFYVRKIAKYKQIKLKLTPAAIFTEFQNIFLYNWRTLPALPTLFNYESIH